MEPVNLIRVFIASPGDVQPERQAVRDACATANLELGDYLKVRLEAVSYERHVIPSFGSAPQAEIFAQIPFERLDLFVGILANRFGTPTETAGSGTEDEFRQAASLWERTKKPHIMLYFADKALSGTADALAEKEKVMRFRDSLDRAIYQPYRQDGGRPAEQVFAEMFRTHLSMWLTRSAPPPPRSAEVPDEFKIIHLTINDFEWYHLLQLWKSDPHPYSHAETLEREMRTLERMQLVRFRNQVTRWSRLPTQGQFLLRDHVDLTDFGKRFIEWRRQFPPYNELW
jgi:hypothetical protein